MARKSKGVLPPVKSGHAVLHVETGEGVGRVPGLFWITLDKATLDKIHNVGYAKIIISLPTGEDVVKRVTPANLFMGNRICIYRRSTGEWALRNFSSDRKRKARHRPEEFEGVLKGMTGDMPRRRRRRRRR